MKFTLLVTSFMVTLAMATPTPVEADQVASVDEQITPAGDEIVNLEARCTKKGGKCTGIKGQCCGGLICTFDTHFKNGKCK